MVRLNGFYMNSEELDRWWSDIIASTLLRGMDLYRCRFRDAASLATALTSRKDFKSVSVALPTFENGTFCDFCRILATRVPFVDNLEELLLGYDWAPEPGPTPSDYAQAAVQVIQSISHCSRLKSLALELRTYAESVDRALAACIGANSSLEKISMTCTNTRFLESQEKTCMPLRFPAVFNALGSSCSIQCVEFKPDCTFSEPSADPWDPDDIATLNMVLRLNRSGRSYIKSAPANVREACKVPAAVSDDLDCLYFHIRENPQIFDRALCEQPSQGEV
jgi:hypothetical protein